MSSSDDPRLAITLNLEESGWLCKAMMSNNSFRNAILNENADGAHKRMIALYERLAMVNDSLMGKK